MRYYAEPIRRLHQMQQRSGVPHANTAAMRRSWQSILLPVAVMLNLLEPLVRGILGLAMVLGILTAVVFEISAVGSQFAFWAMIAMSLGCGVALIVFYGLHALLSR